MIPVPNHAEGTQYGARGPLWSCHRDASGKGVHTGVDFPAVVGTPVVAARPGVVVYANHGAAFGQHQLEIRCSDGTRDFYAHMSARTVADGTKVRAGQQIGKVGQEGNVTGPHLHFERHTVATGPWSCGVITDPRPSVEWAPPKPTPTKPPAKRPTHPTTRRAFLKRRRKHHRGRPAPLVVRVANCASVSTGPKKSADTFHRALNTPGKFGLPDVALCQEMSDVDAAAVIAEFTDCAGYTAIQHGKVNSPDSALVIVYRTARATVVAEQLLDGTPATREGGGIRKRPILRAALIIDKGKVRAWSCGFLDGHAAPSRAPKDRAAFVEIFQKIKVRVRGGDLNWIGRVVAAMFGQRVFSIGVLHLIVSRFIPAEGPEPVDHGSDHKGVDVRLWPALKAAGK